MLDWNPPQPVVDTVERYQRNNEVYKFSPVEYRLFGGSYYAAIYTSGDDNSWIFMNHKGERLRKSEMRDIVIAIISVNGVYNDLRFNKKVEKVKHDRMYKRNYHLLTKAENWIKKDGSIYKDFLAFKNIFDTCIHYFPILRKTMKEIREIGEKLHRIPYLDETVYQRILELRYEMGRCMFYQNHAQIQSYESRKNVVRYLWKRKKYWLAIRLWYFHWICMSDNLSYKDRKMYRQMNEVYLEGKDPTEVSDVFEPVIQNSRNPN
ncbi:hypothetical protein [Paludifilum halophilum]|uniref:Uncharacterized protein n=1 Tax=Paludifilum halophilum TaxID=1642702 RepID=A0A235B2L5_9BACL|nr:hypothetical protein [Paludifilum halophilum]OYD06147.1 hypothetical protein CHM34_17995 [Paludifilum halophilum]